MRELMRKIIMVGGLFFYKKLGWGGFLREKAEQEQNQEQRH